MKRGMNISLRAGEKIFVNGAVLRTDRKVSLEFMNDVTFLLENHVMQPADATTPLRQLYLITQTMLIDPPSAAESRAAFESSHALLLQSFENEELLAELKAVHVQVADGRVFDALKSIRSLYKLEADALSRQGAAVQADRVPDLEPV